MDDPIIRGALTICRPVRERDRALLTRWFGDPEFVRWWGGKPKSPGEVEREFLPGLRDAGVACFIVETSDARAAGYIQCWEDPAGQAGGIDVVLAPPFHGRGLGRDAVAALARYLRDTLRWTRIVVDPALGNAHAIRAFEKAGFVSEHHAPDHPDGPALIMAFR